MSISLAKFDFPGGLRFRDTNAPTSREIRTVKFNADDEIFLPLNSHVGNPSRPLVQVGQRVRKNQAVASAEGHVSVVQHAPTSGTIQRVISQGANSGIVIRSDGCDEAAELPGEVCRLDQKLSASKKKRMYQRITDAGIIGMGGAGFPAHVKLSEGFNAEVNTLIINGVECEPRAESDSYLLANYACEIASGINLVRKLLNARRTVLAVGEAFVGDTSGDHVDYAHFSKHHIEVIKAPPRYPAGSEKQLIEIVTGDEVPTNGLPIHLGVVCFNVATIYALYRAALLAEPLISRWVTINTSTARMIVNTPIGMSVATLLNRLAIPISENAQVTTGGMMMGRALDNVRQPVLKTTSEISVNLPADSRGQSEQSCIRCGECVVACPVRLHPQKLFEVAKVSELDMVQDHGLFDCIECGCCDYVCPSNIPLVSYFVRAKTQVNGLTEATSRRSMLAKRYDEHRTRVNKSTTPTERVALLAETSELTSESIHTAIDQIKTRLAKRDSSSGKGSSPPGDQGSSS